MRHIYQAEYLKEVKAARQEGREVAPFEQLIVKVNQHIYKDQAFAKKVHGTIARSLAHVEIAQLLALKQTLQAGEEELDEVRPPMKEGKQEEELPEEKEKPKSFSQQDRVNLHNIEQELAEHYPNLAKSERKELALEIYQLEQEWQQHPESRPGIQLAYSGGMNSDVPLVTMPTEREQAINEVMREYSGEIPPTLSEPASPFDPNVAAMVGAYVDNDVLAPIYPSSMIPSILINAGVQASSGEVIGASGFEINALKYAAKGVGKVVAKKIPFVGVGVGAYCVYQSNDYSPSNMAKELIPYADFAIGGYNYLWGNDSTSRSGGVINVSSDYLVSQGLDFNNLPTISVAPKANRSILFTPTPKLDPLAVDAAYTISQFSFTNNIALNEVKDYNWQPEILEKNKHGSSGNKQQANRAPIADFASPNFDPNDFDFEPEEEESKSKDYKTRDFERGDNVGLDRFTQRFEKIKLKDPKTKQYIEKDNAFNSGSGPHDGTIDSNANDQIIKEVIRQHPELRSKDQAARWMKTHRGEADAIAEPIINSPNPFSASSDQLDPVTISGREADLTQNTESTKNMVIASVGSLESQHKKDLAKVQEHGVVRDATGQGTPLEKVVNDGIKNSNLGYNKDVNTILNDNLSAEEKNLAKNLNNERDKGKNSKSKHVNQKVAEGIAGTKSIASKSTVLRVVEDIGNTSTAVIDSVTGSKK